MRLASILVALLTVTAPSWAQDSPPTASVSAGDHFVYLGSFNAKPAAQAQARRLGGWVLRSDLYQDLTPGFFAVVRGPFRTRTEADSVLALIQPAQPDAYVRHAGRPVMPATLGEPALLAAVLGDLTVVVTDSIDIATTCAPSEPYMTVVVGFTEAQDGGENASASGYWMIERTGEVMPIRVCTQPTDVTD